MIGAARTRVVEARAYVPSRCGFQIRFVVVITHHIDTHERDACVCPHKDPSHMKYRPNGWMEEGRGRGEESSRYTEEDEEGIMMEGVVSIAHTHTESIGTYVNG